MAEMMQFDLVSPEARLASLEVSEVRIPGADGDMTAMSDHAPTITTLRPGILSVVHASGADEYVVLGGFADISGSAVTVLAERAMPKADLTRDAHQALVAEFTAAAEKAKEAGDGDAAAKTLADMVALEAAVAG